MSEPNGIDQQLDAGVADDGARLPGADAAGDADPASDEESFAKASRAGADPLHQGADDERADDERAVDEGGAAPASADDPGSGDVAAELTDPPR